MNAIFSRSLFFALTIYLLLAPSVFAINSKGSVEKKVAFRVYNLPKPTQTDAGSLASRAVVRAFLAQNPQYEITPQKMPSIQGTDMETGTLMGIASGNPPHGIYVNFRQSSNYINHGFLAPMEILLARLKSDNPKARQVDEEGNWLADPSPEEVEYWKQKMLERVAKPAWPVIYRTADVKKEGIPQGKHIWALPTSTLVKAMLYRKDLFKQAGLDPNVPPDNWEELIEAARDIKALPNKYGLCFMGGPIISWGAYSFLVSNGVRYMERNEEGAWSAAYNTRDAAEAIHFIKRLDDERFERNGKTYHGVAYISNNAPDMFLKWKQGSIGISFTYLDREMLQSINPELIGIAPIPKSPKGVRAGEINCRMLGVFSKATPQQQLAVMDYVWFVTGDEAEKIRTRIYVENGYGRFVNPILLERYGYDEVLRKVPPGWRETFLTALETGVPEPYGQNTQFIYEKVSEPINWALEKPLLDFPKEEAIRRIKVELDGSVERVNKHLLGKLTPEEWRERRMVGGLLLLTLIVLFSGSLIYVWRSFVKEEMGLQVDRSFSKYVKAYMMILPAFLVLIFWQYAPVILSIPLALMDYELVIQSKFVGIDNFATILYDMRFWSSLAKTFYYVILVVAIGFWPPILVAILLDEVPTQGLKYFFRTIYYLPQIVSGVILVFLWRQMYESSESGALNQIILSLNRLGPIGGTLAKWFLLAIWLSLVGFVFMLAFKLKELTKPVRAAIFTFALVLLSITVWPIISAYIGPSQMEIEARNLDPSQVSGLSGVFSFLGGLVGGFKLEPFGWIDDPAMAMVCCVIPMAWATAGPGCIIYLAALKSVPHELVEAASVDGASIIQKISYITLPRIKFLILIQLVGTIVAAFKGGTNFILAMTGGGPNGATRVLGIDIFRRSFMELNYGNGAAMAWVLGALVIVITAYQLKRMSRAEFKTANVNEAEKN